MGIFYKQTTMWVRDEYNEEEGYLSKLKRIFPNHFQFQFAGDNNPRDDRLLYAKGQMWLNQKHIMGRAVG